MSKSEGIFRSQRKQWLAALAASLAMVNVGNEEAWILQSLRTVGDPESIRKTHRNLIWAVFLVAATSSVVGAILGAVFADVFGRRRTLLVTSIFAISQIINSLFTNAALSCVTLFLGEIGVGITRVVVPLYVSEIVEDNIRGTLLMLQLPFFYVGKLLAAGIGDMVPNYLFGIVSMIFTGIFLATFTWFPETPYYLALKKKDDAATNSLAFYRGITRFAAEEEIEGIIKNAEPTSNNQGCCGKFRELIRPSNRKGLIIVIFLIIAKWSEQIFDIDNGFTHVMVGTYVSSESHAKIIAYGVTLITSIVIASTIDVIGRRSYLVYSTAVAFAFMIFILLLIATSLTKLVSDNMVLILYFCEFIIFAVPLVYVGEFFTTNVKALAIAILTIFNLLMSIFILVLAEATEFDVSSFCSGIILLFVFPITLAFIPETKRKSFADIQSELGTTWHFKWLRNKLNRRVQTNRSKL